MNTPLKKSVFLAEDDEDDRMIFEDALKEVQLSTKLTTAKNGQQLMQILHDTVPPPPDVIFLDLNMPRKNGFECLEEIKRTQKLKDIPVVIFSTSFQEEDIKLTYERGANFYICKPGTFHLLKRVIEKVLFTNWKENIHKIPMDEYILKP
ncbi:MAG: response regulator [Cyclobacteriaceae bacterium]|nr:response regulator [Cyclobacteriaceae bacterium]